MTTTVWFKCCLLLFTTTAAWFKCLLLFNAVYNHKCVVYMLLRFSAAVQDYKHVV